MKQKVKLHTIVMSSLETATELFEDVVDHPSGNEEFDQDIKLIMDLVNELWNKYDLGKNRQISEEMLDALQSHPLDNVA